MKKLNISFASKASYRSLLMLSMPIVIQNLFSAAISSADVIMLSSAGQSSISAVSLAVQYTHVMHSMLYGLGTGVTILGAQYWGKGNVKAIERIEGIALRFSILLALLFALPFAFVPRTMMLVFTKDPELVRIGADYLRLLSISYICWGISEVYLYALRSVERVRISTFLNVMTLLINIGLNAVFIYGLFGAPKMGAAGVALATSISRAIQLLGCFLVSAKSKDVHLSMQTIFERHPDLMQDFVHMSLPAMGNDIVWGLGFSMYSVIMGHMNSDIVAANSIIVVIRNFGTVFCYAIGSATGIFLGKTLGADQLEKAKEDASRAVKLTVLAGILGGIFVLCVMPFALHFVALTDTAKAYLKVMLLINSYYITGTALNTTMIVGVFRAGGDSRFGLICDIFDMWVYSIPLGFFSAFVLKLPPMWVYFLICTDEFVKWPFVIRNYKSGKWIKNITRDSIVSNK